MLDDRDRRELNSAQQAVNDAQRGLERAQDNLATARAKLPRPDWSMKLEPLDPEPIAGCTIFREDSGHTHRRLLTGLIAPLL